jgi:hypothetical protein
MNGDSLGAFTPLSVPIVPPAPGPLTATTGTFKSLDNPFADGAAGDVRGVAWRKGNDQVDRLLWISLGNYALR